MLAINILRRLITPLTRASETWPWMLPQPDSDVIRGNAAVASPIPLSLSFSYNYSAVIEIGPSIIREILPPRNVRVFFAPCPMTKPS